jgi:hypothetical protein
MNIIASVQLIILVTLSLTRTIGVIINCFINYTRNIEFMELQFIVTRSTLLYLGNTILVKLKLWELDSI